MNNTSTFINKNPETWWKPHIWQDGEEIQVIIIKKRVLGELKTIITNLLK